MVFTGKVTSRWSLHRIHKWMGLSAATWLIVLGLTGFLLDHRDTWRWLWQGGVSAVWLNESVTDKSKTSQTRLYQINNLNPQQHVTGGLTGLWWSENAGGDWNNTDFIAAKQRPMISTVLFSSKNKLWIASDDGLWLSDDGGKIAMPVVLAGNWISSLAIDEKNNTLMGVIDRTKIFSYDIENKKINFIEIKTVNLESLPNAISLSRFIRDIHYGRGVFYIPLSLLWNDVSAIAMIVLSLSGFLFYWLPRRWRKNKELNIKVSHKYKKQTIRWLFRLHGPTFGLLTVIPFVYLSLTGILLDHGKEFRNWMSSTEITRNWQTPVYNLNSWDGEIYGIDSDKDKLNKFSVATRLGLFTTHDNGQHWQRERMPGNKALFVWSLRRHGDTVFIGGMGGPNMVKTANSPWSPVKGVGHMPSDITIDEKNNWVWKSRHGLMSGNTKDGFTHQQSNLPVTDFVPWFYVIDGLHSGVLIHSQWKWINDLISVFAIVLVITGLIRWWRKKWI